LARRHREQFHALVRENSRLQPLETPGSVMPPGVVPENVRQFKEHFGEDLADVERCLLLHLSKLPYRDPFADWPHYVAAVARPNDNGERLVNVFRTQDQAERWCQEIVQRTPPAQRSAVQTAIRAFPNRPLAELFAKRWLEGG
jgi:hypothetical protein